MTRQYKAKSPEPKPYRKLYLKLLDTNRRKLEELDTLEGELHKAYKDGAIPTEHYNMLLQGIQEERLIVGDRLERRERKIEQIRLQESMEGVPSDREVFARLFCSGENIGDKILK